MDMIKDTTATVPKSILVSGIPYIEKQEIGRIQGKTETDIYSIT